MNRLPLSVVQGWDDRIAIGSGGGPSADYQFGSKLPKPCFHPLRTAGGHVITGFEMSDHVWHRGLWFTIKFINESNFWEERPPFGVQASVGQPRFVLTSADSAEVSHSLDWVSEATGKVLTEERAISYRVDSAGVGIIDWSSRLVAMQDLLLDRTPYTTWGGYGGLAFRASRQLHKANYLLPSGETKPAIIGERHDWLVLQALTDDGVDQHVSLGMIDHPENPRGQSPWYCKAQDNYILMNAAFLFHEPMAVKKGEVLHFRYRVMFRDGSWTAEEFAWVARAYRGRGK